MRAPAFFQLTKVCRSGRVRAMGLSTKTGRPASMKGRARRTCSKPSSVATKTASTWPITSSGFLTTWGIREAFATSTASFGSSVQMWVTWAPGTRTLSKGSPPR